jgi:pimeloyl-ACP methyl ester carboxylesterase
MRTLRLAGLIIGIGLLSLGGWQLSRLTQGVLVTHSTSQGVPLTIFAPASGAAPATVVIAHGFAGSQQLMYPLATTLARNGFTAITFDFPGHGRNASPLNLQLSRGLSDTNLLGLSLDNVVGVARQRGAGPIILMGHSMGSAAVVDYANAHPEVVATVGISLVSDRVSPTSPRNLLITTGALEFANIRQTSLRALRLGTGDVAAGPDRTYGELAAGTARRLEWTPGVEHISILFAPAMARSATAWAGASIGQQRPIGYVDRRMLWVGMVYAGGLLLIWLGLGLLPQRERGQASAIAGWRRLALELGPAILTPLAMARMPTGWSPILVGGYVAGFFAVYGLAQWLIARGLGIRLRPLAGVRRLGSGWLIIAGLSALLLLLIGGVAHTTYLNFLPTGGRLPTLAAFIVLLLPYFLVDAAIVRSGWGLLGARLLFLLAILGGIMLRSDAGFLLLILPLFVVFFALAALIAARLRQRSAPLVAAVIAALLFGWMLGIALPYTG